MQSATAFALARPGGAVADAARSPLAILRAASNPRQGAHGDAAALLERQTEALREMSGRDASRPGWEARRAAIRARSA